MKRLQSKGLGSKCKQAEPISEEEEELLWAKGLLGDHSPQALLNTMVFMIGLYFALRSGMEHRELRYNNSQIEVFHRDCERPNLLYTEDSSKNHPGGLRGRRVKRKVVKHHANIDNPKRCFVKLYQKYRDHCPLNPKRNAFYLQPLKKPTETLLFSREPLGHNKLQHAVNKMSNDAGIEGYRTNHSLQATNATRLFSAGADEQLIMERTGHRSVDGVRSYKRTSDHLSMAVSDILNCQPAPKPPNTSHPQQLPSFLPSLPVPPAPTDTASLPHPSPHPIEPSTAELENCPFPSPSANVEQAVPVSVPVVPVQEQLQNWSSSCTNNSSSTSIPGAFNFYSCGSVTINISK